MNKLTKLKLQEIFEMISRLSEDCAYEIEIKTEEDFDITKAKIKIKLRRIEDEINEINDWIITGTIGSGK